MIIRLLKHRFMAGDFVLNDCLQRAHPKSVEYAYLNNKKVLIIDNIPILGLCKVQYIDENIRFFVDRRLLFHEKQNEKTLCLSLFKGV